VAQRFFTFIISTLLTTTVLAGPPNQTPVEVTTPKIDTVIIDIMAVGTLRAAESVIIRSEIAGRIVSLHFSEGQAVKAGTVLVKLDPSEYEAGLAESTAAVKLNSLNFNRVKDLYGKKLVSRQDFDEAQAKLDESRAQQALDKTRLQKTKIIAPFDGILGLRNISEGAYIRAGDDLVTLNNMESVKLDFRVSELFLPKINIGQTVKVEVDAYPDPSFTGKVYALNPVFDEETRTILLRARIPNPDKKLYSGMFARVRLVLETHENAILIPEQAITPQGKDSFVYKLVDGKALLSKVILGKRRTGDVEILEGIEVDETIITTGHLKLQDGMAVTVIDE